MPRRRVPAQGVTHPEIAVVQHKGELGCSSKLVRKQEIRIRRCGCQQNRRTVLPQEPFAEAERLRLPADCPIGNPAELAPQPPRCLQPLRRRADLRVLEAAANPSGEPIARGAHDGNPAPFELLQQRWVKGEVRRRCCGQHYRLPAVFGQVLDELCNALHPAHAHRREVIRDDQHRGLPLLAHHQRLSSSRVAVVSSSAPFVVTQRSSSMRMPKRPGR
jgi:hypothetical protein